VNRLAEATSPYLQQHRDNPVDWWEWGSEAFAEATRRDVPIFLSVGYAACHWCHVMAHESFEDAATATQLNSGFVPIKVDREERPDVDSVYMTVTQAMTGQGGWPMSVFLTPDGQPFHAGTYFPPRPAHGMPSFGQVLDAVTDAWTQRRGEVTGGAARIVEHLRRDGDPPAVEIDPAAALRQLGSTFDETHAGFGGAPKFPPSLVLEALLRAAEQGDAEAERMLFATLDAMARGGIYDQLVGGFARYSVDAAWVVPHFEKMLYDNALLIGVYARASALADRRSRDARGYERVVTETVEWLRAEMLTDAAGFAASLDADSLDDHGHSTEGAYYAWTPDQLAAVLGDDAPTAMRAFAVTERGTFEHGASTLQLTVDPSDVAEMRVRLAQARAQRPRPGRDDKVVAAWNGWLVDSLTSAAMIMDRPDWLDLAVTAATMIKDVHWVDGVLHRASRDGRVATAVGVAEDYAAMALGSIRLATATGDSGWLAWAVELLGTLRTDFAAEDGGVTDTSTRAEQLIMQPRDLTDNATPSGSSTALLAARLMALLTGEHACTEWAERIAASLTAIVAGAPRFAGWPLADAITQRSASGPVEVAVVGAPEDTAELTRTAWRNAPAGSVVVTGPPDAPDWVLLRDRTMIGTRPTAYVCRQFLCRLPVTDPNALIEQLTVAP